MKNAHEFGHIYDRLGIDLRDLGCIMLNTENPVSWMDDVADSAYVSPDPKKFWVKGLLDHWHVTVRYGLLPGVTANDVDEVLGWLPLPTHLYIDSFEIFPSPYPDEEYECMVARVDDQSLRDMNAALSVLPNVNTFVEYKPHITVGYFKKGQIPDMDFSENGVGTLNLDYGHNLPRL